MTPLYSLPLHAAPEVIDRIPSGYSNFVIPFVVGISFMLVWLTVGLFRLLAMIPSEDRRLFWRSLINPKIALKNIKDLFCDCLSTRRSGSASRFWATCIPRSPSAGLC